MKHLPQNGSIMKSKNINTVQCSNVVFLSKSNNRLMEVSKHEAANVIDDDDTSTIKSI